MKIFIITGQTATGKTSFALNLAKQHNGELINCDSRQVYKHLDIITGKDLTCQTFHLVQIKDKFNIGYYRLSRDSQTYKIWLYDIVDPKDHFSSFDYQRCAVETINDIISRGKTPIVVGGTYFYLKHLLYDVATEKIEPDWNLRKDLENTSVEELQLTLKNTSKTLFDSLNQSDKNNPQRLIRKIEIAKSCRDEACLVSTNKITLQNKLNKDRFTNLETEMIGLKYQTKEELHTIIERRVEKRIHAGAVQEVEQLIKLGYSEHDPGLRTIGYQQIIRYLKKEYSKEEAVKEWIIKEKQYAKRQDTFMKKDQNIVWKKI